MSDVNAVIVQPFKQFVKDSIHLVKKCTKPDRKEFARIASATMIGFLIMGASRCVKNERFWDARADPPLPPARKRGERAPGSCVRAAADGPTPVVARQAVAAHRAAERHHSQKIIKSRI